MVGGNLTGSGTVKKGILKIRNKLKKDLTTEGNETLELKLFTDADLTEQVGNTKEIVILDKSKSRLSSARLFSNSERDKLYGNRGNNNLRGDSDVDHLYGDIGNDKFYSGDGKDTLIGAIGKNDLYGGIGNDVFNLTTESGYDRIRNFTKGEDRVDIAEFGICLLYTSPSPRD